MSALTKALGLLLLLLLLVPATAQEQPGEDDPDADPEVVEVDDDKAKEMLAALEEAEDTRDEAQIAAAIKPFLTARNQKFVKPLGKLAKHKSEAVRLAATRALGSQAPAKKAGPSSATSSAPALRRSFA